MITVLQDVLNSEIPLTKAIGITVKEYNNNHLTITAPLKNNINHQCTAFGGSLYSISVLTAWGLLYLLLKENDLTGHIVIQKSNTQFLKPVETDITAICSLQSHDQFAKFVTMYQRKGIARIKLETRVISNNKTNVIFNGSYVVHK